MTTATTVPKEHATATIKWKPVEADGPGVSVKEAIANAGSGGLLVNGILLREVDGSVWLCTALLASSPPRCAKPRLLVENFPGDEYFDQIEDFREVDGVRWIEHFKLFGTVHR